MSNILITYGTRPLAQRAGKIAQQLHHTLFATCEEIPSIFASTYHKIPHGANPVFAHELLKLCLDQGVDYILPMEPSECTTLADTRVLFEEYGISVLLPTDFNNIATVQNPPSNYPMELFHNGKSLWSATDKQANKSGLYTLINEEWHWVTLQ